MSARRVSLALLPFAVLPCAGQNMPFAGGTMHVDTATIMVFEGPLVWQLAPDAQVINDGSIDLGTQATVLEVDGTPITGAGTETATWPSTGALTNVQPGGLGLSITSAYAAGDLHVQRGHLPSYTTNGTPSIARWYRISTPQPTSADMSVVLHYDLTELNGVLPAALSVFEAPDLTGIWTALVTTGDEPAQTLSATDQSPSAYLTAFDYSAVMGVQDVMVQDHVRVWPTIVDDAVHIAMPSARPIERVELLDGTGKCILQVDPSNSTTTVRVPLPSLASGVYLLRVNGDATGHRLIKP